MDNEMLAQEMAEAAAAIAAAANAQDRPATTRALTDAITALMSAYAVAFGEVPPWGPSTLRNELEEALRQKRSAN
jgi:hypothetical protein